MQNFEKIVKSLCDNGVDFVIIGGFAAVVHGVSLLTQDIDIATSFDSKNAKKLLSALKDAHPVHRENKKPLNKTPASFARFKNLYLLTDAGSIDMLGEVAGLGKYKDVLPHTIEVELFGRKCRVLDIDAVIRSKKEMKRPKDKEAIIQLKAIREKQKT